MDAGQRNRIQDQFRQLDLPDINVLDIPDDYEFMDEELIDLLTDRITSTLRAVYDL